MDADHHALEVTVFIGDSCIGGCHFRATGLTLRVAGAVLHPGLHTVGIHHRCPEVVDGGGRRGGSSRATGQGAVCQRNGDRARTGIGVGVGVFVGDRLDDVLVVGRGPGAADRDLGAAVVAGDGDGVAQRTCYAGATARGQLFISRAIVVVHRTGSNLYNSAGNRLVNIGSSHIDVDDADRARACNRHTHAAAYQETGAEVVASGAGVQVQHRRVVDIRHRDGDRIARR